MYEMLYKVEDSGKIIACICRNIENNIKCIIYKKDLLKYNFTNAKVDFKLRIIGNIKLISSVKANKLFKILYHGSHTGLVGKPNALSSRIDCDFGIGFYTGDLIEQAESIIVNDINGIIYKLFVDLSTVNVYNFNDDILWALYVGVNRKLIKDYTRYKKLVNIINHINKSDVIIGLIADDRMALAFNSFIEGSLTDKGLIACLKYLKLGNQYVFKNNIACDSCINILTNTSLDIKTRERLQYTRIDTLKYVYSIVDEYKKMYRRKGNFIDECLERFK